MAFEPTQRLDAWLFWGTSCVLPPSVIVTRGTRRHLRRIRTRERDAGTRSDEAGSSNGRAGLGTRPKSEQVAVHETNAHNRDRSLQGRIDEAGDEDHAEKDGCMISDVPPQAAMREGSKKCRKQQDEAHYSGSQERLNKGIVNTGRKQCQQAFGRDRSWVGQERELLHARKLIPPSHRLRSEADANALCVERGRERVGDKCEPNAGVR